MLNLTIRFASIARSILILLLILLGVCDLSAQTKQKFSVANFDTDPFDFSAREKRYEKFDGNGERYAIIKVTSNTPDDDLSEYIFNFGNLKHIVEEHDGVLWVYVQRNAKLVTISRNGYFPVTKYDLHTTIESGKNYVMSLTSDKKRVYTQMVQFNVRPASSGAMIMVKSTLPDATEEVFGIIDSSGSVARNLHLGTYTYKVLAENYFMSEGRFSLNNRAVTLVENVDLKPNFSQLTLTVDADADIYINDEKKGTRTWSGILKSGSYQIECRQENHKPSIEYIEVADNDNRTITLPSPTPILGTLSVTSKPLGGEILIDGVSYGSTPKNIDLVIGNHALTISKGKFKSPAMPFVIKEDQITEVNIPLGDSTIAIISSTPTNAEIFIDGKLKGNTPYSYDGEIGTHRLKLTHEGYKPFEKMVFFGNTRQMNFALKADKKKEKDNDLITGAGMATDTGMKMIKSKNWDIYLDAGFGISMYGGESFSAALGAHVANFNAQFEYIKGGLSLSQTLFLTTVRDSGIYSGRYDSQPEYILAGKLGYGFKLGKRFKITPQAGYRYTRYSPHYVHCVTIGARGYCEILPHFGVSFTPEYSMRVAIEFIAGEPLYSSTVKKYAEGFSARIGLVLTF